MFSALGKSGLKIQRHMSPASTRGPWTMKFIFSQLRLSTVSFFFFLERVKYVYELALLCAWGSSVWSGTEPILLSAVGRHPNPTGKDHTLRPLISLSLSFSSFRCVFQHSSPPCILPVISTDLSSTHQNRQMSV